MCIFLYNCEKEKVDYYIKIEDFSSSQTYFVRDTIKINSEFPTQQENQLTPKKLGKNLNILILNI